MEIRKQNKWLDQRFASLVRVFEYNDKDMEDIGNLFNEEFEKIGKVLGELEKT
jgi:hypothetical protein